MVGNRLMGRKKSVQRGETSLMGITATFKCLQYSGEEQQEDRISEFLNYFIIVFICRCTVRW